MKNRVLKSLLAVGLLALQLQLHLPALADDTDLFVGVTPSPTDLPNLMIVLDNAANFSSNAAAGSTCVIDGTATALSGTVGGVEQCALYKVISEIATSDPLDATVTATVNIGMMVYNANNIRDINNANCGGANGGCLVQPLVPLTAANKTTILNWIKTWKTTGGAGNGYIKASGEATGAAMQETWAYFAGHTGLSGRSYASIKPVNGCQNNYTVFVGNSYSSSGTPGDSAPSGLGPKNALVKGITSPNADMNANPDADTTQTTILTSTLKTTCGTYTFPSSAHETKGFYADEWARYMAAQNIKTYTVGVLGSSCQAEYAALLTSMATVGLGTYFPTNNYDELVTAFKKILGQIQAKNSVFAAVSLPVSVNTQGTYLNQVFVGMFRPDISAFPRWQGNLKQYKLGYLNGALKLLDADSKGAISSNGGFIDGCARSYWTPTLVDSYWSFKPQGDCQNVANSDASNYPDGNIVEKGAQAYMLRSVSTCTGSPATCTIATPRTVKTCSSVFASCTSLTDFNNTNVSAADLTPVTSPATPTLSTTERDQLINWETGLDVDDENGNKQSTTEMRPSAHGDVVHSRPVAINYGTDVAPQVVVYYGGNDGVLRAINGNRSAAIGSVPPGGELWAFVAPEFYPFIKRIRDNTTQISYFGFGGSSLPKPYGMDGSITAYQASGASWIYTTMRRGGRVLYAFDVTTPASPVLKWKKGCPHMGDDTDCTSNFGGIGQTWSAPKVLKASGYASGNSPLLIMGGGYDTCEDGDPNTCTGSSKGNKVYVMDATDSTGTLLKTLNTDRGVVGDVFVVPDLATGLAKLAYVADLGGNIYRINIGSDAPASWTITKIASLGCDTTSPCSANRKFMFAPDVLLDNGQYVLLIGSGDREKPLTGYTSAASVANEFFMLRDDPSDAGWLSSESGNCGGNSVICKNSLYGITGSATPTIATVAAKKGWYLALNSTEQVVTSAITVFGTVTFSTHTPVVPKTGACSSTLGTACVYNIAYTNAASMNGTTGRCQELQGGGLPPSPVAGMVTLDSTTDPVTGKVTPGQTVPFIIGASPASPLEGGPPAAPLGATQPKSRVYWNIQQ